MRDLDQVIDEVFLREGREYSNRAADRGGPTKFGVTLRALERYRRRPCTPDDVRNLTEAEAREVLRADYYIAPGLYRIHDPYVAVLMFDCAINHGAPRAVRWLQKIVGVVDDGIMGDKTEIAVASYEPTKLYRKLCARRVRFYGEIIAHDPELARAKKAGFNLQAENAFGWANRAAEFVEG